MKNEKENKTNRHAPKVRERKGAARARICEKRGTTPLPPLVFVSERGVHLSGMGAVSGKGKRKGKTKRKEKKRRTRWLRPSKGREKARPM